MAAFLPSLLLCVVVITVAEHTAHMKMRFKSMNKYTTVEPVNDLPIILEDQAKEGFAHSSEYDSPSTLHYTALTLMHDQSSYNEDLRRFQPAVWFKSLLRARFA